MQTMTQFPPAPPACSSRTPIGAGYALGSRASFWVSAGVVVHTLWTSAAPAMTYRLYAAEWQLTSTITTAVFAIYPIVVVGVLIGFGNLSGHIGRRATMLLGLAASLAGVLLFAVAPSVAWLFVGRALMGLGVGLAAAPATVALMEFSPIGRSDVAGPVTAIAQAVGFACALLIGGGLVEYGPSPMRLPFWILSGVIALLMMGTWFLPRTRQDGVKGRWRPTAPSIPRGLRRAFAVAAIAVTTAYTHGALILSLGAQVARDLAGSQNALVTGMVLSSFALLSAMVSVAARPLAAVRAIGLGAAASTAGMGLLAFSVAKGQLLVFLLATAASGTGYGLLVPGGLQIINESAPARQRAGMLSAVYLIAYASMGGVALAIGISATAWGLSTAVDLGSGAIAALSLAVFTLIATTPCQAPPCSAGRTGRDL